ncbi:unnamed protein product [Blepharisma stoltei]|uniref:Uncharacterized protein n=1 Tax=Blepharisma stoltei TaxID=1481888 RepID=A0AAU9J1Q6_9CILI|nr:unnamed protein product [Blepharisma stoltei]
MKQMRGGSTFILFPVHLLKISILYKPRISLLQAMIHLNTKTVLLEATKITTYHQILETQKSYQEELKIPTCRLTHNIKKGQRTTRWTNTLMTYMEEAYKNQTVHHTAVPMTNILTAILNYAQIVVRDFLGAYHATKQLVGGVMPINFLLMMAAFPVQNIVLGAKKQAVMNATAAIS